MSTKIKTSVSIDQAILERLRMVAEQEDRSASYILERIIEGVLATADDAENFADALQKYAKELKTRGQNKIKQARH